MNKRIDYGLPDITITYYIDGQRQQYRIADIEEFLEYVLNRYDLSVRDYLPEMGDDPFFLVAATGLGKTVAVPIHVYLRQSAIFFKEVTGSVTTPQKPMLYVVEPRIPIAEDQMYHMNSLFADFIRGKYKKRAPKNPVLFGCITSATSNVHPDAPIKFVTTGLLGIYAENDDLTPVHDAVIIDEAHVTIEQNEDVELAIGVCLNKGITIHYMSATVDTSNVSELLGVKNIIQADKQRYPIWLHNLGLPLEDVLVGLVETVLVNHDTTSEFFPPAAYFQQESVLRGVDPRGQRASGMLIVVNSIKGEFSDVNRYARMIETAPFNTDGQKVRVLRLASETIRNRSKKAAFDRVMDVIHRKKEPYVIIATSVVEMGITYPTLDYVVTMDSGFESEVVDGMLLPRLGSLGVNALKQRVGRVGRKRPGIGYITREVGADYTSLSDKELNTTGLEYEVIKPPYAKAPLTKLAVLSLQQNTSNPQQWLANLGLPSEPEQHRLDEFMGQRKWLQSLGIANRKGQLTNFGKYCIQWIGLTENIEYAVFLQDTLARNSKPQEIFFYLILVALSQHDFAELIESYGQVDIEDEDLLDLGFFKWSTATLGDVVVSRNSDITTLYNLIRYFSNKYSKLLYGDITSYEIDVAMRLLRKEAMSMGLDGLQVKRFLDTINSALRFFQKINQGRADLQQFIGSDSMVRLDAMYIPEIQGGTRRKLERNIRRATSHTLIVITETTAFGRIEWQSVYGQMSGSFQSSQTGLELKVKQRLTARLIPRLVRSDDNESDDVRWIPSHMQHA